VITLLTEMARLARALPAPGGHEWSLLLTDNDGAPTMLRLENTRSWDTVALLSRRPGGHVWRGHLGTRIDGTPAIVNESMLVALSEIGDLVGGGVQ